MWKNRCMLRRGDHLKKDAAMERKQKCEKRMEVDQLTGQH